MHPNGRMDEIPLNGRPWSAEQHDAWMREMALYAVDALAAEQPAVYACVLDGARVGQFPPGAGPYLQTELRCRLTKPIAARESEMAQVRAAVPLKRCSLYLVPPHPW